MTLFKLTDLCVDVPSRRLLDRITVTFEAGAITGLVGKNGSGKSTLLKVIARQTTAGAGDIEFDGHPLASWPHDAFARNVAYLPQTLPLAEGLLIQELVALGRYPWHGALGRPGPDDAAAVDRALRVCGLDHLQQQRVDTLSGGEAQRAWLALLIAQDARCLLLDEPTSALDIATQMDILGLVRQQCKTDGRGAVVIIHDINLAARFCDHIVALRDGRVAFDGAPDVFMKPPLLKEVFDADMEVMTRADGSLVALPH
ncbi:MAG: ATP-binding cassette domain-containing protein [Pseudomonadota bacterium]